MGFKGNVARISAQIPTFSLAGAEFIPSICKKTLGSLFARAAQWNFRLTETLTRYREYRSCRALYSCPADC